MTTNQTAQCTPELLRQVPDLEHLPIEQLQWLITKGSCFILPQDGLLFSPEEEINELRIILKGRLRFFVIQQGQMRIIGDNAAPFITGLLPYSRLSKATGSGMALEELQVLTVHKEHFPEMIRDHYELTAALVHNMTDRVKSFTSRQQQDEKLMSLGKLSAGLAHELNNPAAAVVRSARALKDHLKVVPDTFKNVIGVSMSAEAVDQINQLLYRKAGGFGASGDLSLMDRTRLEDDLATTLEDMGIDDGFAISENLVDFGFTEEDIRFVFEHASASHFPVVMHWINSNLVTEKMVSEIEEASNRIGELVKSIKSYTHMDQSQDKQDTDIHKGLNNTITMLAHKIRSGNLSLEKDFSSDLPLVKGFPGEMNQVFTNVLDNAIDAVALQQDASIQVRTHSDGEFVRVYIRDNGPGIPEEIRDRIFDPFYTTKKIGEGTGMGLDMVKKIMDHHRGRVEVQSEPGRTEFCLCFPIAG